MNNEELFVWIYAFAWIIGNLLCITIFGDMGFILCNLFFVLAIWIVIVARYFSRRLRNWFDN